MSTTTETGGVYVIALCGKAGHGKSAARELLVDELNSADTKAAGFSLAEPVRTIASSLFGWDGGKDFGDAPDNGRRLLISVGMGMRAIRASVWIDYLIRRINGWEPWQVKHRVAVIDDVRFDNEVEALRAAFPGRVRVLHVVRDSVPALDTESEQGLDYTKADATVPNNGSKDELRYLLLGELEALFRRAS